MANPLPSAPGIQYPTIRQHVAAPVDDAVRNIYDNLMWLRSSVASLNHSTAQTAAQTTTIRQTLTNTINTGGGGGGTTTTATVIFVGTHASRLSLHSSPLPVSGTLYYETDRYAYYAVAADSTGTANWILISAHLEGLLADRPADLTVADIGFRYYLTDATRLTEQVWSGSAWVDPIPDASSTIRGAVTTGIQSFAGNKCFTGLIQLAGITNAYPALKRSTTKVSVRLADDSLDAPLTVLDEAYGAGWNGKIEVPTKNAVYDKIEAVIATIPGAGPTLASGVYTPTLTNVTNLSASTPHECQYLRVGGTVTVSGYVEVDPTIAGLTQLGITLPVASNIGAVEDCAGCASCPAVAGQCAAILGDVANDRAQMEWIAVDITNQPMYFTFSYQVI